jgi:hypothetical protein
MAQAQIAATAQRTANAARFVVMVYGKLQLLGLTANNALQQPASFFE